MGEFKVIKRKGIFTFLFIFLFLNIPLQVFANTCPNPSDYGAYLGTIVGIRGDLSASGLSTDATRDALVRLHWVYYENVNTSELSNRFNTTGYELQEQLPSDDFSGRSGYHLLQYSESLIKTYANRANGNPDYVWNQIQKEIDSIRYIAGGAVYVTH